jgi:threonine dehydratase
MAVITEADVRDAAARLAGVAEVTPVLQADAVPGLFVKAECFQRTGSFKFRGAYNRMAQLTDDERARGVAAFSSGNHAQAVALAAREVGTTAVILMPHDAPETKVAATIGYGAEVVRYDRYTENRDDLGRNLAEERRRVLVPPFDDARIMAGQGTAALELLDEVPDLDALVVPVGAGGLVSGCATIAKARRPSIRVIGVEPAAGDDVRRSVAAGHPVSIEVPRTIADGQQTTRPGDLTFAVIRELVDDIVLVSDEQIVDAMRVYRDGFDVVAEPSGACALAAVLAGLVGDGGRVGVVLSGGNVDPDRYDALLNSPAG